MSWVVGVLFTAAVVLIAFGLVGLLMKLGDWLWDRIGLAWLATVSVVSGLVLLALAFAAGAAP